MFIVVGICHLANVICIGSFNVISTGTLINVCSGRATYYKYAF